MDNNVWIVGDENEVVMIDAAHDADKIAAAIGGRRVAAVVWTHAPDDHVNRAPALADRFGAPILLNPADLPRSKGGPGATGRSFSSFDTIIDSIRDTVQRLPGHTSVRTGHGESTTVDSEAPHLEEWIVRGH